MKNACEICSEPAIAGLNDEWFCMFHFGEALRTLRDQIEEILGGGSLLVADMLDVKEDPTRGTPILAAEDQHEFRGYVHDWYTIAVEGNVVGVGCEGCGRLETFDKMKAERTKV